MIWPVIAAILAVIALGALFVAELEDVILNHLTDEETKCRNMN